MKNIVLILDFGGEDTQKVAREIRKKKVFCKVLPGDATPEEILSAAGGIPGALVLSGEDGGFGIEPHPKVFDIGCPVLSMGYAMNAMIRIAEGELGPIKDKRTSKFTCISRSPLLYGMADTFEVLMYEGHTLGEAPSGFKISGYVDGDTPAFLQDLGKSVFGIGFYANEIILDNFLFRVSHLEPDWTMSGFVERSLEDIKRNVGNCGVIAAVSGGVDSTVATLLVHRAIGDNLRCVMVDHGLLRKDEAEYVQRSLKDLGILVNVVDAKERFLQSLKGVTDPEEKRKIIGEGFIRVFEEWASLHDHGEYMVQGTIYPDVIESGSRLRGGIKSHHNVGGLPDNMHLKILEPLRDLFKDEVRAVGEEMGLPKEFIERHPFPGPGLAVRILGEITPEKIRIVKESHAIFDDEIKKAGLYSDIWQGFCVLPDVRTVGVVDGKRTYGHLVALRAVNSEDAMTATWSKIPHDILDTVSRRIIREVRDVGRVVYDITSKPPGTIEWE